MYGGSLHIGGAVQAVGDRVGATARYDADGQGGTGQTGVRVVGIDLLILRRSQNQPVECLGERAVAADAHHRLSKIEFQDR